MFLLNPYIRGAAVTPTENIYLADNFGSGVLDPTKWDLLTHNAGFTVAVTGGQLEITGLAGTNAIEAVVSLDTWDMTGRIFQAKLVNSPFGLLVQNYFVAVDGTGKYFGFVQGGTAFSMTWNNGTDHPTTIPYALPDHQWLRLRHNADVDKMFFEVSPDGLTWTIVRAINDFATVTGVDLTDVKFRMQLNFQSAGDLTQIWDNFKFFDYITPPAWNPNDLTWSTGRFYSKALALSDGASISNWPNVLTPTPATAAGSDRPTYRANSGDPYAEFATNNLDTQITTTFADFCVIAVVEFDSLGAAERFLDKTYNTGFWCGASPAAGGDMGGGIRQAAPPYGLFTAASTGVLYAFLFERHSTTKEIWLNTTHITEAVSATALDGSTLRVGSVTGGGANGAFKLRELVICDGPVSTISGDVTALNAYLTAEYGLTF